MVEADWEKRTLPKPLTDECRKLYTEAVGEGWREVAGTIIMDKNNTVVGFRMHFVKDGKESKEVVVPASPELAEQYDMEGGRPDPEGMDVATTPPPTLPEKKDIIPEWKDSDYNGGPDGTNVCPKCGIHHPYDKWPAFRRCPCGYRADEEKPEKKGKSNPWAK